MHFYPLLRNADDRVFLIHAELRPGQLHAGLLVVDGYINDGWLAISDEQSLAGLVVEVQLPQEVIQQSQRYKGYAVVLPLRHLHEQQRAAF